MKPGPWIFKTSRGYGDEYGAYNIGRCYYNGWGCEKDYHEAFAWFERADKGGHPTSKSFLAQCYFWGRGTELNYEKAVGLINS